jgi:hypothetical protein
MTDSTNPSGASATAKPATSSSTAASGKEARVLPLHVLDLGTKKSKDVEDLKRGRGKLVDDVADAIMRVEATLDDPSAAENVVPVVLFVERKRKRKNNC